MAGRVAAQERGQRHDVLGLADRASTRPQAASTSAAAPITAPSSPTSASRASAPRTAHYQRKVQAVAAAQRDGLLDDDLDPAHLVFLLIALAAWWQAVPQLARMLTGADDADDPEHARRRACVVRAAQRLALPPRSISQLSASGRRR